MDGMPYSLLLCEEGSINIVPGSVKCKDDGVVDILLPLCSLVSLCAGTPRFGLLMSRNERGGSSLPRQVTVKHRLCSEIKSGQVRRYWMNKHVHLQ